MEIDEILAEYTTPDQLNRKDATTTTPSSSVTRTAARSVNRQANRTKLFSPCSSTTPVYSERKGSGDILFKFGLAAAAKNSANFYWSDEFMQIRHRRCAAIVPIKLANQNALTKSYSYMHQLPYDVITALSNRLDSLAEITLEKSVIDKENFTCWSDVNSAENEELINIYGQIFSMEDGKLDVRNSLCLQGSFANSSGRTVLLNLSEFSEQFSFFPGQFVALSGLNPTGKEFLVKQIHPLPLPEQCGRLLFEEGSYNESFTLIIAAGPFTTSDNLDFQPLHDLIDYTLEKQPDVLILIGPFVPVKHHLVEQNLVLMTYDKIFDLVLNRYILVALEKIHTKILIVSSSKDVTHDPIYPCPPYSFRKVDDEKLTLLPDPCMVFIGGVCFALTSTDVLFDLSKEEVSNSETNRMNRLLSHLITQRSFYPLYPPNENLNVDYAAASEHCSMTFRPHVLVIPSNLRQFTQEVNQVCCINPGQLSKGQGGGTFCRMQISPQIAAQANSQIAEWIGADIMKI